MSFKSTLENSAPCPVLETGLRLCFRIIGLIRTIMVDGYRGEGGEDMVQLTVAYCMKGYHIYIHIMDEKIGIKVKFYLFDVNARLMEKSLRIQI